MERAEWWERGAKGGRKGGWRGGMRGRNQGMMARARAHTSPQSPHHMAQYSSACLRCGCRRSRLPALLCATRSCYSVRGRFVGATGLSSTPWQLVRDKMAAWFITQPDVKPGTTKASFRTKFDALADSQLMASASTLAKNRPLFSAAITGKIFTIPYDP